MTRANLICAAPFHGGLWRSPSSYCPAHMPCLRPWLPQQAVSSWKSCCRSSIAYWTGSGKSWVAKAGHYLFIQEKCHDKWLSTSLSPCRMDLFIYLKFIFIHLAGGWDYKNISLISTISGIYADTRFGVVTNHTIYCLLQCPNTFPPPSPSQSN